MNQTPEPDKTKLVPDSSGYGMVSASEEDRTPPSNSVTDSAEQIQTELAPEKLQAKVSRALFKWSLGFWILNIVSVLFGVVCWGLITLTPQDHPDYRGMWLLLLYFSVPLFMFASALLSIVGAIVGIASKERDDAIRNWTSWNGVSVAAAAALLTMYLSWFIPQIT